MRRSLSLAIATAATLAALSGCGSLGSSSAAAGAATSASTAAPSPPDCRDKFISWRDGGGRDDLNAVTGDLTTLGKALTALQGDLNAGSDPSAEEATTQQAAASLQSDTQTAQANLPPSCVPGLRRDISPALTDYNRAAIDCDQAVTEISSGNGTIGTSDIYAAAGSINAGNKKMEAAVSAIKAFAAS